MWTGERAGTAGHSGMINEREESFGSQVGDPQTSAGARGGLTRAVCVCLGRGAADYGAVPGVFI